MIQTHVEKDFHYIDCYRIDNSAFIVFFLMFLIIFRHYDLQFSFYQNIVATGLMKLRKRLNFDFKRKCPFEEYQGLIMVKKLEN